MKIKDGFVLKEVAGSFVAVPTGDNLVDFSAMITLNETGAFLWTKLASQDMELEQLADALCAEYDVPRSDALNDAAEFVEILKNKKVLI